MPTRDEVTEEVKQIIHATLGLDPASIQMSSTLGTDLQVSSMELIEIVFAIEHRFDMRVPDDALRTLGPTTTFDDVIDLLYRSIAEKQSTAF